MHFMSIWSLLRTCYRLRAKQELTSLCSPLLSCLGPNHHDGLLADLRNVPDQIEEADRQDDSHRAALRGRVPLCQLPPHYQQVNMPANAQTLLMYIHLLQYLNFFFFLFSEEIAFYNGNMREKQTIHATFKKLVGNSLAVFTTR